MPTEPSITLNLIPLFDADVLMKNYSMRHCYYLLYIYLMYTNVTAITEHHFIALLTLRLKQRSKACYQEYVKPV